PMTIVADLPDGTMPPIIVSATLVPRSTGTTATATVRARKPGTIERCGSLRPGARSAPPSLIPETKANATATAMIAKSVATPERAVRQAVCRRRDVRRDPVEALRELALLEVHQRDRLVRATNQPRELGLVHPGHPGGLLLHGQRRRGDLTGRRPDRADRR